MSPQRSWIEGRVDALLAALHELGMSASRAAARELIAERVRWVSSQIGISPTAARRYLTDEAVADLAATLAFAVVEETPGADMLASPRTAAVPLPVLGRGIAGLGEAIKIRLHELDDLDHTRTMVTQLAHALAAIGIVVSDTEPGAAAVLIPPGLINRVARYLEAAATLVNAGVLPDEFTSEHADQLATTFRKDAANWRYYADS